jgi:hypothetical protein
MSMLILGACASTDRESALATKYKPASFIGLGGYKDKMITPDTWQVSASANSVARRGFAGDMAVYRAAELAKKNGYTFFQIIKQDGSTRMIFPTKNGHF